MTIKSGRWITYYLFAVLKFFGIWEVVQLIRRKLGNKSALTASQFVTRRAKKKKKWAWINLSFALLVTVIGIWLIFHWETLCHTFGWLCEVDV